jgi:hypothetical protein
MKFKVLQKSVEYKNCPIIIRQSGEAFEYITCIFNEIYSSHVIAKKSLLRKLFFRPYSLKQLNNITNYMLAMAQSTIDSVLGDQVKPKKHGNKK